MKKLLLIAVVLISCLCGCSAKENGGGWSVEDFELYNEDGNLYDYPLDSRISLNYYNEEDYNYRLKSGLKLGSKAKVALEEYDLTDFYCAVTCYPTLRSNTEEENKIEAEYLSKYPDVNEAVKHTSELAKYKLSLFVSSEFYYDSDKLIKMELNEKGNPVEKKFDYDRYDVNFRIKDDEIIEIYIEHKPSID